MHSISQMLKDHISELLKPHTVCVVMPVIVNPSTQPCDRLLVLSLWRAYLVTSKQPVRVESTFSYLEICSITIHSLTQIEMETETQTLSLSVLHIENLEAMLHHMTAALKKIFPDSSPGKLLKQVPSDLHQRLLSHNAVIEDQLNNQPVSCGGYSDTYAALCDFNEMPFREEIQWDVDNLYCINNCRQFNLLDFSHLDSSDLALAVAALSFNQWFTKIYNREHKLSVDIQQQLIFLLSRSTSLEELSLEASGLRLDFTVKMAAALQENTCSALQSINLSGNPIEDKGIIALSKGLVNLPTGLKHLFLSRVSMTARGLGCLSQVLGSSELFSASLTHLDLSNNPSCLVSQEAMFLFRFLSRKNCLSHLDLSDTNCPLDVLFVSLSAGCCYKLMHLNLARNPYSHRKVREATKSIHAFFRHSRQLKYVGLSATKLPPHALKLLLQGLASNTFVFGVELDLSSCELCSTGAQVIQEHISEATAIQSLDISDNGFENDMVTLILSFGRSHSLRHLSLGRNFAMKSRNLADALYRIALLIQDEECPLQSLSLCDSKLGTEMHILLNALGGRAVLSELDISGNSIGDNGAKILAKSLISNTRLRSLRWDGNCITARGFQDVADALERNLTLQQVSLPLADITQSYCNNPKRTKEALHKIQHYLDRNNQRQSHRAELQQLFRVQQSEKLSLCSGVRGVYQKLDDSLHHLNHSNLKGVQADIMKAHNVLCNTTESSKLLPPLYEAGRPSTSDGDLVNSILTDTVTALTNEFNINIQELTDGLMRHAEEACPQAVQQSGVCESLSECMSKCSRQTHTFLKSILVENAGQIINSRLSEFRQTLSITLAESIAELIMQELTCPQNKMSHLLKGNPCLTVKNNFSEIQLVDNDFPTDDYSPAFWGKSLQSECPRTDPSLKSQLDVEWEQQTRDRGAELERGGGIGEEGGRCGHSLLSEATLLSIRTSSPSPSPLPSPLRWRWREGEEVVVDAATAISRVRRASSIPPPALPLLYTISAQAPDEEAAGSRDFIQEASLTGCGPTPGPLLSNRSPMEPLPMQGQALRHYTASRPRPRRTKTQPPSSRPQVLISKVEVSEGMVQVDEGVEEFFTKKIIPDYALKGQWEESRSTQATPSESNPIPLALTTFCSLPDHNSSPGTIPVTSPSVPSTDTSFTSTDGPPLSTSPIHSALTSVSTTSAHPSKNIKKKFGDFFAFKRVRASQTPKTGDLEGGGEGVKFKRTSIADLIRPLRETRERDRERKKEREKGRWAKSMEDTNISNDATTTEGTVVTNHLASSVGGTVPGNTLTTTMLPSETTLPYSTSIMSHDLTTDMLSCLEEEAAYILPGGTTCPVFSSHITEQGGSGTSPRKRRIKLAKRLLRESKSQSLILLTGFKDEDKDHIHSKNTDEELRKANSQADLGHPMRAQEPTKPHPTLHPKQAFPKCPARPVPPKLAEPPLTGSTALPGGGERVYPISALPSSSSSERVQLKSHHYNGKPQENAAENGCQDDPKGGATVSCPPREQLPEARSLWRSLSKQDHCEKTQSITDEPKAVLQKSPIRIHTTRVNLATMDGEPQTASNTGKHSAEDKKEELKTRRGSKGGGGTDAETKHLHPTEGEHLSSRCSSSTSQVFPAQLFSPAAALHKAPSLQRAAIHKLILETPRNTSLT